MTILENEKKKKKETKHFSLSKVTRIGQRTKKHASLSELFKKFQTSFKHQTVHRTDTRNLNNFFNQTKTESVTIKLHGQGISQCNSKRSKKLIFFKLIVFSTLPNKKLTFVNKFLSTEDDSMH